MLAFCTTRGLLLKMVLRKVGVDGKFLEPRDRFEAATLWRFALGLKRFDDTGG